MQTIQYTRGETKPIRLDLVDENGAAVDITGYTAARFAIAAREGGTPLIEVNSTDNADVMAIVDDPGSVAILLTAEQSEALPNQAYCQAWVTLGGYEIASELVRLVTSPGIGGP